MKEVSARRARSPAPAPAEPLEAPSPLRGRRGRCSRDDYRPASGKRTLPPRRGRGRRNDSRPRAGQPAGPRSRGNGAHRKRAGSAGPPSGEQATGPGGSSQIFSALHSSHPAETRHFFCHPERSEGFLGPSVLGMTGWGMPPQQESVHAHGKERSCRGNSARIRRSDSLNPCAAPCREDGCAAASPFPPPEAPLRDVAPPLRSRLSTGFFLRP